MTTPANFIGPQPFVRLSLPGGRNDGMETVYQHGMVVQRDGVDGTAFVQTGVKGDPFQMSTLVDVDTFANAQSLRVIYKSLVSMNLYEVSVGGLNYYTVFGHKYIVQDVKAEAVAIGRSVGGLVVNSIGTPSADPSVKALARVDALWTLVPIYVGIPDPPV